MQNIKEIPIDDLCLWSENPRDPIDISATDEEIIYRALENKSNNWNLDKMLKEMGEEYYYNEIPTVVFENGKYVVYDGNRRLATIKCLQNPTTYSAATGQLPFFSAPDSLKNMATIPCNVCDKATALKIVERTHKGSNKWGALQYEQFQHIHLHQPKGVLMVFDEVSGGSVTRNAELNSEYFQKSILTQKNLNDVGLNIQDGCLFSSNDNHKYDQQLVEDIAYVVTHKYTNARKNARQLKQALTEYDDKYNNTQPFSKSGVVNKISACPTQSPRRLPVKSIKQKPIFGGVLRPRGDRTNEVYRAIEFIYSQYLKDTTKKDYLLPVLGMSLRLMIEIAAQEFYAEQEPPEYYGDKSLDKFMKEIVKPSIKDNPQAKSYLSLSAKLICENSNFTATYGRWAHGLMPVTQDVFLQEAEIVGDIIRNLFSR